MLSLTIQHNTMHSTQEACLQKYDVKFATLVLELWCLISATCTSKVLFNYFLRFWWKYFIYVKMFGNVHNRKQQIYGVFRFYDKWKMSQSIFSSHGRSIFPYWPQVWPYYKLIRRKFSNRSIQRMMAKSV